MPVIKVDAVDPTAHISNEIQQYVSLKDESDNITARIATLKKRLTSYIEDLGSANEKGSIVLPVSDERTGVKALVKQRRVSKKFDENAASSILKEKGLEDTCLTTVTVLDQDAVMAAYYEGKLTDGDIETMFPESVSWALILEKK